MVSVREQKGALFALLMSALCLMGCGEGVGSEECGVDVSGTVFSLDEGSASVRGSVTLPPGTEDGRTINLMVVQEGSSARYGVVPDLSAAFAGEAAAACISDGWTTDGPSFTYEILLLDAGSYRLHLKLLDDTDEEVYDQSGQSVFVVNEGDDIVLDEVFAE